MLNRATVTMDKYQKLAQRTSPDDGHDRIDNGVLGLIGETGELVDVYKKWQYQSGLDAKMPVEKFADELGDVLWYMVELAAGMDSTLKEISGADFADLDRRAAKCDHQRTLRSVVTGLSGRANRLNKAIQAGEFRSAKANIRWMLVGCARLAWIIGYNLEMVAGDNIAKLKKRYPEGFDPEISMGRYEQ